jgi:hypothetical protein
MFEIGKWGKILDGEYANWFLMIDDDTKGSTGGFYIYTVKDPDDKNSEGYDNWVENYENLSRYVDNINFQVDWNL